MPLNKTVAVQVLLAAVRYLPVCHQERPWIIVTIQIRWQPLYPFR